MNQPSVRALQSLVGRLQVRLRQAVADRDLERRKREQVERVLTLYLQGDRCARLAAAPAGTGEVVSVLSADAEPSMPRP